MNTRVNTVAVNNAAAVRAADAIEANAAGIAEVWLRHRSDLRWLLAEVQTMAAELRLSRQVTDTFEKLGRRAKGYPLADRARWGLVAVPSQSGWEVIAWHRSQPHLSLTASPSAPSNSPRAAGERWPRINREPNGSPIRRKFRLSPARRGHVMARHVPTFPRRPAPRGPSHFCGPLALGSRHLVPRMLARTRGLSSICSRQRVSDLRPSGPCPATC